MARSRRLSTFLSCAVFALTLAIVARGGASPADLPTKLSDAEFWSLSEQLSEPNGNFQSDNLVSNETGFQKILGELTMRLGEGGVYLGVGPEQNFTYLAALKPRMAFILDIRRGNRDLHLMYKAIFELSADRAEFVSLLFSRPRPDGLGKDASALQLFAAIETARPDDVQYERNFARIVEVLTKRHSLPLSPEELDGIKFVYSNFFRFGPGLGYASNRGGQNFNNATYSALMRATDANDVARSYLASDENFNVMKRLEAANLLVPVVGNFSGPKALRAIGTWLKDHNATVSAYYVSNVEEYLNRDGSWLTFCANASTLPLDGKSTFIRSGTGYRPAATQLRGSQTMTLPDGRVMTVYMSPGATVTSVGGLTLNRLGLMREDLEPCATPKLDATYDAPAPIARHSSR